jgi:hypothetical protein
MIGQDYHLLGSKPRRIKSSDEHVGARTTPLGYAARLKQKIQCVRAGRPIACNLATRNPSSNILGQSGFDAQLIMAQMSN